MKKWIRILSTAIMALSLAFGAGAESPATPGPAEAGLSVDAGNALTAGELAAEAERLKAMALAASPINDPAGEDARYEDGILHLYEFGALYCDRAEMTAETEIQAFSASAGDALQPRGKGIDSRFDEITALYPNGNPALAGTREAALLYLDEGEAGSFRYGMILRDGQRIQQIVYGAVEKEGEQFRMARLTYSLQGGIVSGIQATGLGAAGLADSSLRNELYQEVRNLAGETGYTRVPSSEVGTDLTPFGPEDLRFGEFQLDGATPESMPGQPEIFGPEEWEGDASVIRVVGEEYEAVFRCEADGSRPRLWTFDITGEDLEGPRAVRLGDALFEDMNRFRHGENETDGVTELLYGENGKAPFGLANYAGDDGMSLTYATTLSDGREITMTLRYEGATLKGLYMIAEEGNTNP